MWGLWASAARAPDEAANIGSAGLMQKRQSLGDQDGDHSTDGGKQCPPDIVVSVFLPEPPSFDFIAQPTKRYLLIRWAAAIERVAGLFVANACQLGAPSSFYFGLGHRGLPNAHAIIDPT